MQRRISESSSSRVTPNNPTSHFQRHNRLNALAEALAAKRPPLHTATQDAVDLPKMVQVVCRFQADELLDRLPPAYLVDPIALHPPCARDRLQQSQVARAAPERPLPKGSHLAARNPSAPPMPPHPTKLRPRPDSPACFAIATPSPAPRPPSVLRSRQSTTFQVQGAGSTPRARHRADADRAAMGGACWTPMGSSSPR